MDENAYHIRRKTQPNQIIFSRSNLKMHMWRFKREGKFSSKRRAVKCGLQSRTFGLNKWELLVNFTVNTEENVRRIAYPKYTFNKFH